MKDKQHDRFQKLFYENLYLLKITDSAHEIIFNVSGSTSNIYMVKIMKSFEWNHLCCNCPDSKKWANINGVFCKHILFIIFKVLKLFSYKNTLSKIEVSEQGSLFLEKRKLHKDYIEAISVFIDLFEFKDTEFMKLEYVERFNEIKDKFDQHLLDLHGADKSLTKKENGPNYCLICFDEFDIKTQYSPEINTQCLVCKTIFHKQCINKWFLHNNTCPYCRSPNNVDKKSNYINLFN